MAEIERTTRKQSMQMAGVIAGAVVSANTLFFVLSRFYFAKRSAIEALAIGDVRMAFGILTLVVGASAYIAALSPRYIGHGLATLMGLASLSAGIEAFSNDLPAVMGVTLLIVGVLMPVLAWKSWSHSRAAWAFLIALVCVFGGVTLFGAPKIKNQLHVGLWTAMIIPGMQIVTVIALAMLRGEYRQQAAA